MAKPYARLHSGHQSESGSAQGGRQFIGQAENLTSVSACRLLYAPLLTYLLTHLMPPMTLIAFGVRGSKTGKFRVLAWRPA